jgi:rhamnogalacturonan endolyase
VLWRTPDNKELRLYTTTTPTEHRLPTLMHDPQYRLEPPHINFYPGHGMKAPPRPDITTKPR